MSLLSGITHFIHPGAAAAPQNSQVLGLQGAAAPAGASVTPASDTTGAAQGQVGAEAVQPPSTGKIVLGSVLKGALNGVSLMFGVNFFGAKIPAVAGFMNGTVLNVLTKVPFLKGLAAAGKFAFPYGTLVTVGIGAVLGGVLGLVGGMRKAKKAQAAYAETQQKAAQAQAQNPVGDPLVLGPDGKPIGMSPETNLPVIPNPSAKKNGVMGKNYSGVAHAKSGVRHMKKHHVVRGDTLWALSRKHHTTVAAIVKANKGKIVNPNLIYDGDTIKIPVT